MAQTTKAQLTRTITVLASAGSQSGSGGKVATSAPSPAASAVLGMTSAPAEGADVAVGLEPEPAVVVSDDEVVLDEPRHPQEMRLVAVNLS